MSKIEDLSDELLMMILDEVSCPMGIYFSFYGLNKRFQRIIVDCRLLMFLDFDESMNRFDFDYHCRFMLPNMKKQLISLRLSRDNSLYDPIDSFLAFHRIATFRRLRQLNLIRIRFDQLERIAEDLSSLHKLVRLDIDTFDLCSISFERISDFTSNLFRNVKSIEVRFSSWATRKFDLLFLVDQTDFPSRILDLRRNADQTDRSERWLDFLYRFDRSDR